MIFVHKKSATPVTHWGALRHGGPNNLNAGISGKFLVLLNADIVHREGAWHYILEFDVRDTLDISALAQLAGKKDCYPNDMNWKDWLGADFQVINASVREAILNMPADEARTNALITGVREIPSGRPVPDRRPGDVSRFDAPRDTMLSLPG